MLVLTLFTIAVGPLPADPTALQVRSLLEHHCARCHHGPGRAKGGLGFLLDHTRLIAAGKSHALLQRVEAGEMPAGKSTWTINDTFLLREWVRRGAPSWGATPGSALSIQRVRQLIADDRVAPRDRPYVRYLTLGHLGAAPPEQLALLRHALSKLVNSLSWHARLTPPVPVDADRLVYRLDLRDYRWNARLWDKLAAASPYRTGDILRADWFVATASKPPFYHDFLALPLTDKALDRIIGVDAATNFAEGRVARAGFNDSGVARFNRILERHDSPHGALWRSHDFSDSVGRQNIFESPTSFRPAGGEIIFHLPNGLQGYLIVDADGRRIDKAPGEVVQDPARPDRLVENGLSCMGCHSMGLHPKTDMIGKQVQRNARSFPAEVRDAVEALYIPAERLNRHLAEDNDRFQRALTRLVVAMTPEPILASVLAYERVVDRVADELDLTPDEFETLKRDPEHGRIFGGAVPREVIEQLYARLPRGSTPATETILATEAKMVAYGTDRNYVYVSGRTVYHKGETRPVVTHTRDIGAIALRGRYIASTAGREVFIHERGGRLVHLLRGHTADVRTVAWTPDGTKLISAGEDRTIRIWDFARGVELRAFGGHTGTITAINIRADSRLVVTGSTDRTVRIWDIERGPVARHDAGAEVYAVALDGDDVVAGTTAGTLLEIRRGRITTSATAGGTVRAVAAGPIAVSARGIWAHGKTTTVGPIESAALRPGWALLCVGGQIREIPLSP